MSFNFNSIGPRRILRSFTIGVCVILFLPLAAYAYDLNVGVYQNKPKIFIDEHGNPAGIWIDILNDIARKEGWHIDYVPCEWNDCLDRLSAGEIDLMPDVAFSNERAERFDFNSEEVLTNWTVLYVPKGSVVSDIYGLEGMTVATLRGGFAHSEFIADLKRFHVNVNLLEAVGFDEVMAMVADGRADAGLVSRFYGMMHENKYDIKRTSTICCPATLYFAVSKGRYADILSALDRHLVAMKEDTESVYHRSHVKWLEHKLYYKVPLWIKSLTPIVLGLLALVFVINVLLRKVVQARTRELRQKNLQLEETLVRLEQAHSLAIKQERLASVGALSSGVMHEILNPINIISATVQVMQLDDHPSEVRENLDEIMEQIRRCTKIANNVRMFSRQQQAEFKEVDLNEVLERTISLVAHQLTTNDITIEKLYTDNAANIMADPDQLAQVFLNLINNSRDALQEREHARIHLTTRAENGTVDAVISDNGPGIPDGIRGKIFDQFFTTKSAEKGTGLGLFLVREIVRKHGGDISVESIEGRGTTFVISFHRLVSVDRNDVAVYRNGLSGHL